MCMENNGHGEITIIIVGMPKFTINSDLINRSHAHQIPCSHDVWEGYIYPGTRLQTLHYHVHAHRYMTLYMCKRVLAIV